jgi:hypothetical protein
MERHRHGRAGYPHSLNPVQNGKGGSKTWALLVRWEGGGGLSVWVSVFVMVGENLFAWNAKLQEHNLDNGLPLLRWPSTPT